MKPRLVVFASGEGTNFAALVQASRQGTLAADIVGLVTNRAKIAALDKAHGLGVPAVTLVPKDFAAREDWDLAVVAQLRAWQADWVVLAGFLSLIGPRLLRAYPNRVVNSHPSLLPRHGGAGMYGERVHAAVLAAGDAQTGITIHTIDEEYDRGQILAQLRVDVEKDDTLRRLEARVKAAELLFYPKVLNDLVTGRIGSGTSK